MTTRSPLLSSRDVPSYVPDSGRQQVGDSHLDTSSSADEGEMEEISLSSSASETEGLDGTEGSSSAKRTDDVRARLLAEDRDHATPPELRGSGGCCKALDRPLQVLKAGLAQAASTALTFGTKPLVEAVVLSVFALTPVGATSLAATLTASLVGGVYAGLIHTAVSTAVSGLMNSALSANAYDVREGSSAFLGELGTIDLPVMASFVAGYTVRGAVGTSSDIWLDALSKSVTSTLAGAVQGMVTDAMRQTLAAFEMAYKEKPADDVSGEKLAFIKRTFAEKMNPRHPENKNPGHDLVGKTLGSALGMGLTQLLADREMDSTTSGCVGMLTYLTSWFSGIHAGSLADDLFSGSATLDSGGPPVARDEGSDVFDIETGRPPADLAHLYPYYGNY